MSDTMSWLVGLAAVAVTMLFWCGMSLSYIADYTRDLARLGGRRDIREQAASKGRP